MEGLIWAAVSLVLLVPVLFILPLGLKRKGKFILLAASFLIAIVGILAQHTLPLWQAGLIVVLLAFLTAYLLDQRVGKTLFVTAKNKREVAVAKVDSIVNSDRDVKEVEQVEFIPEQAVVETIEEQELEQDLNVEEPVFEKENLPDKNKAETSSSKDNDEALLVEEDISFLLNREKFQENHIETSVDESSIPSQEMNYMEEIEKILEAESDIDTWMESKKSQQQETAVTIENEDFITEMESSNQLDHQASKSESSTLHEDDVELEEIHFDESR